MSRASSTQLSTLIKWVDQVKKSQNDVLNALGDLCTIVKIKFPVFMDADWMQYEELTKVRDPFPDQSHEDEA